MKRATRHQTVSRSKVSRTKALVAAAALVPLAGVVALVASGSEPARAAAPARPSRVAAPSLAAPSLAVKPVKLAAPDLSIGQAVAAAPPKAAMPSSIGASPSPAEERSHDPSHAHAPADTNALARTLGRAEAIVAAGPRAIVEALRTTDRELVAGVAEVLVRDATALADGPVLDALLALAKDGSAPFESRAIALELVSRSSGVDASTVDRLAVLALASSTDPDLRYAAAFGLRRVALERADLAGPTRTALLAIAERDPQVRAGAINDLRARGATADEVARLSAFLSDRDPEVRASAARALGGTDLALRRTVAESLERAVERETDEDAASAALATAVRVGRADADALLARLARTPIVRTNATLTRQVRDYRELIALGETNPGTVLAAREAREDGRLR